MEQLNENDVGHHRATDRDSGCNKTMNAARVRVSSDFLNNCFLFPEGTQIMSIRPSDKFDEHGRPLEYIFYVQSPSLPEVTEGNVLPLASPVYQNKWIPGFVSWGLEAEREDNGTG